MNTNTEQQSSGERLTYCVLAFLLLLPRESVPVRMQVLRLQLLRRQLSRLPRDLGRKGHGVLS